MKRKLRVFCLLLVLLTSMCSMSVCAKSLMGQYNAAKNAQESSTEVSDGDNNSINHIMKTWGKSNNPDKQTMQEGTTYVNNTFGTLLSVLIMIFFAGLTFTTVTDLLYIGVPFVRPYLYNGENQQGQQMQSSINNFGGFNATQGMPNQQQVQNQHKNICLISGELKVMAMNNAMTQNKKSLILEYMKSRSLSLIMFTLCAILLTTSIFTNFGINVGNCLLHMLSF